MTVYPGTKNRVFRWLARSRKRHYTFAAVLGINSLVRAGTARSRPKRRFSVDIYDQSGTAMPAPPWAWRVFRSLRLSVRTPPFHGGESGSIPLGSATFGQANA